MLEDDLEERPPALTQRRLSEDELLDRQFTESDPESLAGLCADYHSQKGEEPEIEFQYDMSARGVKVRCVYCKFPNHYHGIVVRYPSGLRNLVGRDCALSHHGFEFGKKLADFDAEVLRQDYVRRRRALLAVSGEICNSLEALKGHPAVTIYDRMRKTWKSDFPDIAGPLADVAWRDELLTVDRILFDEAAERARKERLGERFEEERQKAKALSKPWRLTRH